MAADGSEVHVSATMPRAPITPPEQPWPEDDLAPSPGAASSELQRIENKLDVMMKHLERRFDHLVQICAAPRETPASTTPVKFAHTATRLSSDGGDKSRGVPQSREEPCTASNSAACDAAGARGSLTSMPVPRSLTADLFTKRFSLLQERKLSDANTALEARWYYKLVTSRLFDVFFGLLVVANVIMVGVQVDIEVRWGEPAVSDAFEYFKYGCTAMFTAELGLRLLAFGLWKLLSPQHRLMFFLDFGLVVFSWLDIILSVVHNAGGLGSSAIVGKMFKAFRLGRVARLLRTMRLLVELRVMASMILSSLRSIFWLMCILLAITYTVALVLTQGASTFLNGDEAALSPPEAAQLRTVFGSVLMTMYSLIKAMCGGRAWGEIADAMLPAGVFFSGVVVVYVFLNILSVLNIVTGVFVDGAIELAKRDRSPHGPEAEQEEGGVL